MTIALSIEGMSCEHCEQTVADALDDLPGVTSVAVDHEMGTATVEGQADERDLVAAVADAGYEAAA